MTIGKQSPVFENPLIYMVYGGFAAAIFEATARFLGFKFLLRVRDNESLNTGISYGIGHGGIEALLIGGVASISTLITSVMWNGGLLKGLTATMNEQQTASFNESMNAIIATQSGAFLLTGVERLIALTLQVGLSLFVFKAVVEKKWTYFVYAILIHAGVDMIAVLVQRGIISNLYAFEGLILVIALSVFVVALRINKRKPLEQSAGAQIVDGKME